MMPYTIEIIAAIDMLIVILFAVFLKMARDTKNQNETLKRELEDFKKDHLHSFTTMLNKIAENEKQISEKEKNIISQTNLRVNQLESKIYKDFDMYRQQGRQY
tara:strand:- start:388 stop:696 length:309 start_codon:yes stop_codon:yes gene_type:complete